MIGRYLAQAEHDSNFEAVFVEADAEAATETETEAHELKNSPPEKSEAHPQSEVSKPWWAMPLTAQPEEDWALRFRVFGGLSLSMTTYQDALPFEYESLKLPAWSVEAQLRVKSFLLEGDFKSLPAKVYSDKGHLNFYGWRYRHLWGSLGLGWLFENTHHVYLKGIVHYAPTLFPTLVGPLHSEAAFGKVLFYGVGVGYKVDFTFQEWPFALQVDLFNLMTDDSNYDMSYALAWNLRLTRYHQWRNVRLGVSYDQVGQVVSFTEKHTGQDYPVKSLLRLHQILFHVDFPLL